MIELLSGGTQINTKAQRARRRGAIEDMSCCFTGFFAHGINVGLQASF
jgi:hypothetical protein